MSQTPPDPIITHKIEDVIANFDGAALVREAAANLQRIETATRAIVEIAQTMLETLGESKESGEPSGHASPHKS